MLSSPTATETSITREQIRTFHIAGRGLDRFMPATPLWPALFDQLPPLPPVEPVDLASLYASAVSVSRGKARTDFLERIKQTRERLRELFLPQSSAESISHSLGKEAGSFIDAGALAQAFETRECRREMAPQRRVRIEALLATLDEALGEFAGEPLLSLFDSSHATSEKDSFAVALDCSDRQLERFTVLLRALRAARLEIEGAFDPEVHGEILDRFDWRSADAEELAALPPIVVMDCAERLSKASIASFGRLLTSGRPVQILITARGLDATIPDFGYLAVAHRDAFVLQSSVAKLEHLTSGLGELACRIRPAIAIVSVAETPALHFSRAFPLFRYDPDRGETWAERFELVIEPSRGVTAAHVAALFDEFRHHFRIIPDSAWTGEQMELATYLSEYAQQPPLAIPYLWVIDAQGIPQRAIFTRELLNLMRDRQQAWRVFEELAGVKNAHVDAAVARARQETRDTAKREGARQAVHRVIAMLTGSQVIAFPTPVETCGDEAECSGSCNACRAC